METRARLEHRGGARGRFSERPSAACSPDWGRTPSSGRAPPSLPQEPRVTAPYTLARVVVTASPEGRLCVFYR